MSYIGTKTGGHVFRSNAFNSVRYTGDGTTTQYNLPETVVDDDAVLIHIDGVKQHAPSAYSTSGTTLTFTGAPPSASAIEIILFGIGEVNIHVPTSNTVDVSVLKTSDGTAGQVLTTDGSGNLSFSSKSTETLSSMGVTPTATQLNADSAFLDSITSTAGELNILDGVTSTAAELNHLSGVTSAIQGQLSNKEPADTDIVKKNVANTFSANQTFTETTETVYTLSGLDIDPANGSKQYKTLSSAPTFTSSITDGQSVRLRIAGGDTHAVTWPAATWVTSAGNALPTATADDVFVIEMEGSTLYIYYLGSAV